MGALNYLFEYFKGLYQNSGPLHTPKYNPGVRICDILRSPHFVHQDCVRGSFLWTSADVHRMYDEVRVTAMLLDSAEFWF